MSHSEPPTPAPAPVLTSLTKEKLTGKRNTSRAVFTSHERALAKSAWSTSSARLHRESFLAFGSCNLCLEIARDPVACHRGDIFCRECVLANLLTQKKELKRAEKRQKREVDEREALKATQDAEDQDRAIRDFERTQAGLDTRAGSSLKTSGGPSSEERETTKQGKDDHDPGDPTALVIGSKRKFELDDDEVNRIAHEDKAKARKAIDAENASKTKLPSFWTPSQTPDVRDAKVNQTTAHSRTTPICPASGEQNAHVLSMHRLIDVQFDETIDEITKEKQRVCPACRKALSNSSNGVMAKTCGHVLCLRCVRQFLLPKGAPKDDPIACYTCDAAILNNDSHGQGDKDALPSGLVPLKSEGTGFSARGASTIQKSGVGFAC